MKTEEYENWLRKHTGPIILDGGQATELERLGADLSIGSLWSARLIQANPLLLRRVTRSYLEAGADIVCSFTYQATVSKIVSECEESEVRAREIFKIGISIARTERDLFCSEANRTDKPQSLVAASLGSYGAFLADGAEYTGKYKLSERELRLFHLSRVELSIEAKADVLMFETVPNASEANALVAMMTSEIALYKTPFFLSFYVKEEQKLPCGADLYRTVSKLVRANIPSRNLRALGLNCVHPSTGSKGIVMIRQAINDCWESMKPSERWSIRTIYYPNSGECWEKGRGWGSEHLIPEEKSWAESVLQSVEGPSIVGGCCRTTPNHIRALSSCDIQNSTVHRTSFPTGF